MQRRATRGSSQHTRFLYSLSAGQRSEICWREGEKRPLGPWFWQQLLRNATPIVHIGSGVVHSHAGEELVLEPLPSNLVSSSALVLRKLSGINLSIGQNS